MMQYKMPSIKVLMLELKNVICSSPEVDTGTIFPEYGDSSDDGDFVQFGKEKRYEGEGIL